LNKAELEARAPKWMIAGRLWILFLPSTFHFLQLPKKNKSCPIESEI